MAGKIMYTNSYRVGNKKKRGRGKEEWGEGDNSAIVRSGFWRGRLTFHMQITWRDAVTNYNKTYQEKERDRERVRQKNGHSMELQLRNF